MAEGFWNTISILINGTMSTSYTISETQSFTLTHAKYLASKVAADLGRMKSLYGAPNESRIVQFEQELTELLKVGAVESVAYGFQKDGKWIVPTLKYTARDLMGLTSADNDPGKVPYGASIEGADFNSFLTFSNTWVQKSDYEKKEIEKKLPFVRRIVSGEPGLTGYLFTDRTYSSGGRSLERATLRNWTS
jgi:hypothetical protein